MATDNFSAVDMNSSYNAVSVDVQDDGSTLKKKDKDESSRTCCCCCPTWTTKKRILVWTIVLVPLLVLLGLFLAIVILALGAQDPLHLKNENVTLLDPGESVQEWAGRLGNAVKIPSVSFSPGEYNKTALLEMHGLLAESFPTIHSSSFISKKVIGDYSLLYTVSGTDSSLKPYLLMGHLDVVPVDPDLWLVPPFGGGIQDGFVYGRGAVDCKAVVMGILEALEHLLKEDFKPTRTFYIAFGHDEEVGGQNGASEIAAHLRQIGVTKLDYLLDEGLFVNTGMIPGVEKPVAMIGVSEKGYLTLELKAEKDGGHSSMPAPKTAIGILSRAIAQLEDNPQPSMFGSGPEYEMYRYIAPHASFGYKMVYSNLWIFGWLVEMMMAKKPETDAILRTTTAITIIQGGYKVNVVPSLATAIVNHRVHPKQKSSDVVKWDKDVIDNPTVEVAEVRAVDPHPVSPFGPHVESFDLLARTIKQAFKNVVVVPALMIANTDTRWYLDMTSHVYRFMPMELQEEDYKRIHGEDERLSVESYNKAVNFYYRLIINSEQAVNKMMPPSTLNAEL